MDNNKTIGQIISEHRKKKGLTQRGLAEQLNVTDKAVSKWERDRARPDINTIPRISEVLDIPVEMLINIPISPKEEQEGASPVLAETTISEMQMSQFPEAEWDVECEIHKENARHLLIKGLIGFAAGFLFTLITSLSDNDPFQLGFALSVGLFVAGVPYGWELLGKIVGRWFVVGHIAIMLIVFAIKLAGAIIIGWIAYPIALLYNLMKAQRKGSKSRKVWTAIFISVIALMIAFVVLVVGVSSVQRNNTPNNGAAETTLSQKEENKLDATLFSSTRPEYVTVCGKAMAASAALEEGEQAAGKKILAPSALEAAYFVTVKDPNSKHYDYGDNVKMTNAVLIVTRYRVEIANQIQRDEWTVWVYPDFSLGYDSTLTYVTENEYYDQLLCEGLEGVYDWICEEYSDMELAELSLPTGTP